LTDHHFIKTHKQTPDELRGQAMEERGRIHSEKYHPFLKSLYRIGATTSLSAPHMLSSSDLVCRIDLSRLDLTPILSQCPELNDRKSCQELATVEFKCSKYFTPRPLCEPEIVMVGSSAYHAIEELKANFKSQMLQQAAILGSY